MAKRRIARLNGFGCQNTASTQCSAMLVAVDTDGVGWVQRWAPGATWERVDDLPDYEVDPGGPVDPPGRPTEPEPGWPILPPGWHRVLTGVPVLTADAPKITRPANPAAAYLVKFRARLPAALVGAQAEVYLCGSPELGGVQFFARTRNSWLCIGADQAWPWLWELSQRMGQPLESGDDGGPVAEGYAGWCGMRLAKYESDLVTLDLDIQIPGNGRMVTLQIGEDRQPKPGSHTRLPIGVVFDPIEVWAR